MHELNCNKVVYSFSYNDTVTHSSRQPGWLTTFTRVERVPGTQALGVRRESERITDRPAEMVSLRPEFIYVPKSEGGGYQ